MLTTCCLKKLLKSKEEEEETMIPQDLTRLPHVLLVFVFVNRLQMINNRDKEEDDDKIISL